MRINPAQGAEMQGRPSVVEPLSWVPELPVSISSSSLEDVHLRIKARGATFADISHLAGGARVADALPGHQPSSQRRLTFEIIRGTDLAIVPYTKERVAGLNRCGRVRMGFLQRT